MEGKHATKDFGAVRACVHRVALVIHVTSGELQPVCISSLIQNQIAALALVSLSFTPEHQLPDQNK